MSILFLSLTILLEKQEKATAADFDGGGVICRNPNCLSFSFLFVLNAEINRNRAGGSGGVRGQLSHYVYFNRFRTLQLSVRKLTK